MNYFEEYKQILKVFQELLEEENYDEILDEMYDICGGNTKESLRDRLIRNRKDYIELVKYVFSSNFKGRTIQGWIMFNEKVPNFSELSCISIVYNTKLDPLEESDRALQKIYSSSSFSSNIFKSSITLQFQEESEAQRFWDHSFDLCEGWFRDYYKGTFTEQIIYYEGHENHTLIEKTYKTLSNDYNFELTGVKQDKVTVKEWEDIKKKLELFEYNPNEIDED